MIEIKNSNFKSVEYIKFKSWINKEWGDIEQLPESEEELLVPLPLLAFLDNNIAGGLTFILYKSPESEEDVLWINTVFVNSLNRGKGIASKLITEAETIANDLKLSELFVYTDKSELYIKLGWTLVNKDAENCVLKKLIIDKM